MASFESMQAGGRTAGCRGPHTATRRIPRMRVTSRLLTFAFVLAFFLTFSAAAGPAPAKYGAYVNALGQLRAARAYIQHPDSGELHDQEKGAMAEIDQAVTEIESVVNNGKGPDDHPPLDSHLRW